MCSWNWGDVPTWITALATCGAAIGAWMAVRAANRQLTNQQKEINHQRATQARASELQGMQIRSLRRAQAEDIVLELGYVVWETDQDPMTRYEAACGRNESKRPIRNVRGSGLGGDGIRYQLTGCQLIHSNGVSSIRWTDPEPQRVLAGEEVRFFLPDKPLVKWFMYEYWIRFEDDAGNAWELDQHMHLSAAPDTDW